MKTCKVEDCLSTDLASRSAMCKTHHREYTRAHYLANKQYYVDKARRNTKSVKDRIREAKNVPCYDCKQSYPYYVMDFDHRESKQFNIGGSGYRFGWKAIEAEISKCDVVCSNCHRIRTHLRLTEQGEL